MRIVPWTDRHRPPGAHGPDDAAAGPIPSEHPDKCLGPRSSARRRNDSCSASIGRRSVQPEGIGRHRRRPSKAGAAAWHPESRFPSVLRFVSSGALTALQPRRHPRSCESRLPKLLQGRRKTAAPSDSKLLIVDTVSELNTGQRDSRRAEGLKSQHRRTPTLDGSVILLDDVVEIEPAAYDNTFPVAVLGTQKTQGPVCRGVAFKVMDGIET